MRTECPVVQGRVDRATDLQIAAQMMYEQARIHMVLAEAHPLMDGTADRWQRAAAIVADQARFMYYTAVAIDRMGKT